MPSACGRGHFCVKVMPSACGRSHFCAKVMPSACGRGHFCVKVMPSACGRIHFCVNMRPSNCGSIHFCKAILQFSIPAGNIEHTDWAYVKLAKCTCVVFGEQKLRKILLWFNRLQRLLLPIRFTHRYRNDTFIIATRQRTIMYRTVMNSFIVRGPILLPHIVIASEEPLKQPRQSTFHPLRD